MTSVAIIGAGMSGLCMAVKLQESGFDSYTIFEQAEDVGGTWRDNTYPGLHCDVPSRFYSYSFRPNSEWSRFLPPGWEVQEYFQRVADERNIRPHIRFNAEVTSAHYRDGRWWLRTAAGEEVFDVLVTATGVLRVPRYPDIPGRDTFAGPSFHSARWDHSVSVSDKRIGLVGTGSTGVQIVAELGGKVRRLEVFQRTAQWIFPTPNLHYKASTKALLRRSSALSTLAYRFWRWYITTVLGRATVQPGWQRRLVQAVCRWNLRVSVRDNELRKKLTPKDQPMCKRQVMAGHFYRSVQKPGVEVIDDGIDHVEPRGVVTKDGTLHELDVLVFATGFDARAYVRPMEIIGEGEVALNDVWADGPHAYRSIAVPGFPNLFMLMGPHSPIGNQSLIAIAEDQADYIIWWLNQIRDGRIVAAAPTEMATKLYNEEMKASMPNTVWVTGCSSWYLGKDGLPELFPWIPERHHELMRDRDVRDFEVRTA